MSKVVIVKGKGVIDRHRNVHQAKLMNMYKTGIQTLMGKRNWEDSLSLLFSNKDKVGIKINTIAGRKLSTLPEVSLSLAHFLSEKGIQKRNIIIWDRTNRELKDAGYHLKSSGNHIKVFGTDTNGTGYSRRLVAHRNIGSLFSSIQSQLIDSSVSLAILKDHGLAGVTGGMKNYFGAIHNPNKYHDFNCNPFIAELFDTDLIKKKHKLTILDALIVQYHLGPSYHSQWAERYESLLFGLDPVATDFVGWQVIEKLRAEKGLPTLTEEKRKPVYLKTAARMDLGKANLGEIEIMEEEV
ncbi:MAG: DUF362 domain-containing protein [Candidatus Aminicenantes bacterium]